MSSAVILFALAICQTALLAVDLGPENVSDGVIFRYIATGAEKVAIAGEFNGWDKEKSVLTFDSENNFFWIKMNLAEGEYAYKYVINGSTWVKDEYAHKTADDGFGGENSIVVVKRPSGIAPVPVPEEEGLEVTTKSRGNVTFRYKSTSAQKVSVIGSFNSWNPENDYLQDDNGDSVWNLRKFLPTGKYTYFFVIDGKEWRKDVNAEEFVDDGFGGQNSAVIVE